MSTHNVISLIPAWSNMLHNPNAVMVDGVDHEDALRARLKMLGLESRNVNGQFVVVNDTGDAVMFDVATSGHFDYLASRVEFGS
jgi:hypothetical protein